MQNQVMSIELIIPKRKNPVFYLSIKNIQMINISKALVFYHPNPGMDSKEMPAIQGLHTHYNDCQSYLQNV